MWKTWYRHSEENDQEQSPQQMNMRKENMVKNTGIYSSVLNMEVEGFS
jgi:hypothetical protein